MITDSELIKAAEKNIKDYNLPLEIVHEVRDLYNVYYKNRFVTLGTASEVLAISTALCIFGEVEGWHY